MSEVHVMKKPAGNCRAAAAVPKALKAAAVIAAVLLWACAAAGAASPEQSPGPGAGDGGTVRMEGAAGLNAFGLELYSRIASRQGNLFFSPWSVSSSLAPVYEGARGRTRKDMAGVLRLPLGQASSRASFSSLNRALGPLDHAQGLKLKDARSLWIDASYGFRKDYLREVKRSLGASLHKADYRRDPGGARAGINAWVKGSTGGMIEELLGEGMVNSGTSLVIADALYFSGLWALPFDGKQTRAGVFHKGGGRDVTLPMMHQQGRFRTLTAPGLSMIELPYGQGGVSMIILLPDEVSGIGGLEKGLPQTLSKGLDALARSDAREVSLAIPRFGMACSLDLGEALSSMGMRRAFFPGADFSGMTGGRGLYISLVLHKARVEVNEKGTEAAAATGVVMTKGVRESAVFIADHPFVFLIIERDTGAVLFMGRVADPVR